ncbi:MAG: hypothetical protein A2Y38_02480 [Spirochaetes bacterium GWB1_59_5]|nr:MAG: hypothetical protein A2Y38_02480 [Spirochaetes bacterium GWB1_59_5]
MESLGERLKAIRGKMLQEELAAKLGVHKNTYAAYERNTSQPDANTLQKLFDIFPMLNLAWLLTGRGSMRLDDQGVKEPSTEYCPHPIHNLEGQTFPKELDPELLDQVLKTIAEVERQLESKVPSEKTVDVLMIAYTDAYLRGRQVNYEMVKKLVELAV